MGDKQIFSDRKSPEFTLGGLRYFVDYVRARKISSALAKDGKKPKLPTMKSFATADDKKNSEYGNFRLQISKIEEAVGQHLVARKGQDWTSEVTLEGQIWAEFGELVLSLYAVTWNATNKAQIPSSITGGGSHRRIVSRTDPKAGHADILEWLKKQNSTLAEASLLAAQNGVFLEQVLHLATTRYEPPENPHPSELNGFGPSQEGYDDEDFPSQ